MRILLLFLSLMLPAVAAADEPFRLAGADEVANLLGKPGVHVYDANTPEVFSKGHLPGARHIAYRSYPASELPANHGATLIFYCKNPH